LPTGYPASPQITLQKSPRRRYNQRRAGVDRTRQRGLGLGTHKASSLRRVNGGGLEEGQGGAG
jgi:hypothetical protein